jgi:phosphomannomutase/phosphoglucomutase
MSSADQPNMDKSIFRAYSIRGIAGETLTAQDMVLIGQAAGTLLIDRGILLAAVGRDYRLSSQDLAMALIEGLLSTGMDLIDIGTCSTPMLNFATDAYHAGAGFMVTASHNPPAHNGVKVRTDHTLQGQELGDIYSAATRHTFRHGQGIQTQTAPLERYLAAICQRITIDHPLKVVVDAGNGAAGPVIPILLARLGCQVIPLYCEPDGRFPNRSPDPTAPGALDHLSKRTVAEQADAGMGYDGDGDRLVMVDDRGQQVLADRLLALLARDALATHPRGKVVYELSCSQAVRNVVTALGGTAIPCPVGYAFVHETLNKTGAILGGETSGHLFFADPDFRFDDAGLATAKFVALLSRQPRPFSSLLAELPSYYLSPQHRIHCPDDKKHAVIAWLDRDLVDLGLETDRLDGVRVSFSDGWGLLRASNTQPAITMRCEANTETRLAEIEALLLGAAQRALRSLGIRDQDG